MGRWQNNTIRYKKSKSFSKVQTGVQLRTRGTAQGCRDTDRNRRCITNRTDGLKNREGKDLNTQGVITVDELKGWENRQREEMKSKTYDTRAQTFKIKHKITKAVPGSQADESSEAVELHKTKTISSNMLKKTLDSSGELSSWVIVGGWSPIRGSSCTN